MIKNFKNMRLRIPFFLCLMAFVLGLVNPTAHAARLISSTWQTEKREKTGSKQPPIEYVLQSLWQHASILTFDTDMVSKEQIGTYLTGDKLPLSITPDIGWSGVWLDQKTLQLSNQKPYPLATKIVMTPKAGLASLKDNPVVSVKSVTPYPFLLESCRQVRYNLDGSVVYEAVFDNGTVTPDLLKRSIFIAAENGTSVPVTAVKTTKDKNKLEIIFTPPYLGRLRLWFSPHFTPEEGAAPLTTIRRLENQGSIGPIEMTISPSSLLELRTVQSYQTSSPPWERAIRIATTRPVKPETLKKYLTLTPAMDYSIDVQSSSDIIIKGDFSTRSRVEVKIQKGLPSADGAGVLRADSKNVVTFTDFSPRLALGEQGTLASPEASLNIPVTSVNVDRIGIVLREVPESSVPLMATSFYEYYRENLAQIVATGKADIGGVLNKISEQSINLQDLAKGKKGVFILSVEDITEAKNWAPTALWNPYYDSNRSDTQGGESDGSNSTNRWSQKVVVISDIGLVARQSASSITVWANSLATAKPMAKTVIRVYSYANVLLAEGETDNTGLWTFTRKTPWAGQETPALIVAHTPAKTKNKEDELPRHHDDLTYLQLANSLINANDFSIGGKNYLTEGYEALCFTPRGVFRPGEVVPFRVLVRDRLMAAPESFPVGWRVISSTGKTAGQGTAKLTALGMAAFELPLVPAAPTGRYTLEVFLPGQNKTIIGSTTFGVEELTPPRLEVKLGTSAPFGLVGEEVPISIKANYLFGSPASNAKWQAELNLTPVTFAPKGWSEYSFATGSSPSKLEDTENAGTLDENGNGTFNAPINGAQLKGAYALQALVRVSEDGGRLVSSVLSIPVFTEKTQFGAQFSRQSMTAGAAARINVCAVTPEGTAAADAKVEYRIALSRNYYHWTGSGYSVNVDYESLYKGDVKLGDGKGTVSFTPKDAGDYVLVLTDKATNSTRAIAFTVWPGAIGSEKGASPLIDRVMLSWDKKSYAIGDKAQLKIQAPFAGRMLLVVENDQERWRKVMTLDKPETTVTIPVEASFGPNAYVSAWVIRPIEKGAKWGAHRALGLIPLAIDKEAARLSIDISADDTVLPSKDMTVSLQIRDNKGKPVQGEVALAFVDEGLLSLTRYQTPKPFEFFSTKRALGTLFFDRYDELIPLTGRKLLALEVGGSDALEGDSRLSAIARKLVLLSIAHEIVTTDANGKATVTLQLPEYSGKGRIMAIAVTQKAVGSAAKNVTVSRDVTVEATAPRMLAPGDVASVPIYAFSSGKPKSTNFFSFDSENSDRTAKVTVTTEGPLKVKGKSTFDLAFTKEKTKEAFEVDILAQQEAGLGKIIITTLIDGNKAGAFTQTLEVPVRPPFAREVKKINGSITGDKPVEIVFPEGFFAGSQAMRLAFSETPSVSLTSALDYLGDYPHGCLEQTISTTWPYIGVPAMLKQIDPAMADNDVYQKALDFGVRRILAMQRPDGGFVMWPGDNMYSSNAYGWGSVYAMHLLTELRNAGSPLVPAEAYLAGTYWLKRALAKPVTANMNFEYEFSTRAYIAFVLALQGDPPLGWMQFLKDQGTTLNTSARIFLAGAYALAEGKSDALVALGTEPFKRQNSYGWSYESSIRNESLRLFMWAMVDPFSPQAALLAERVLAMKDDWSNTQENAMAVLALGKYLEKTAKAKAPFTATITRQDASGKPTTFATFKSGDAPVFATKDLMPKQGPLTPLKVELKGEGSNAPGIAYYSLVVGGAPLKAPEARENGISVLRRWTLPDTTKVQSYSVQKNGTRTQLGQRVEVEQGDLVNVTLFIEAQQDITSLVITDIAPGGFEIENPNLIPAFDEDDSGMGVRKLEKELLAVNDNPPFKGAQLLNGYQGVRAEVRDDRIIIYVNELPKKTAFHYQVRALSKGTFILPPVQVEGMYDTTINASTLPGKVSIYGPGEKNTKGDAAQALQGK